MVFKNLSNWLAFRLKLFLPFTAFFFIKNDLKKYDLVHIHEFFTLFTILVTFFAKKLKVPYLISAHGTLDSFHLKHLSLIKKIFIYFFGAKIIKNSAGFIAATEEEIKEYKLLGVSLEKIFLVKNGIDFSEFANPPPIGGFRNKFKLSSAVKLILYLGRINKLKGLDVLLGSYSKLTENLFCRLVIAGSDDGYLEEFKHLALKKDCLNKIIFPGILSGMEKLEAYADCDVFVYPSPSEGFSIAILEAAASGLPLVITTGCKFPEVSQKKAGIIVKPNKKSFFDAILKILKSNSLKKNMSLNARTLVRKNYSVDTMAVKLIKCYKIAKYSK